MEPYTPAHLVRDVLGASGAREGERKEVTVLFADVAGSLAMAHALDPEEIHEIMDGFFGIALGAIHAERGTINQFRGDGFMALFGAPRARGGDTGRALRAALAIREATARYGESVSERFRVPLLLRMGVHTGIVWVGSIGSDLRTDYTAEGPTVGLAARLERAARPGQILVSEATARRGEREFELRALRARRFRGVPGSVLVFELVAPWPREARIARARRHSRFVGRERELRWLARATALRRTPALVAIRGEAGIGKSRLAREHVSRAATAVGLEVTCREAERSHAYAPWLELLERWPGELPGGERAELLGQRFGGDERQAGGTPEAFADELAVLLSGAVEARSAVQVVIDDAHWLDPTSVCVLQRLALEPSLRGVAFLLTLRSDADAPELALPTCAKLDLGPLSDADSAALCAAILDGLDGADALAALSLQRAGGNPLFLEEVARTLRDGSPEALRVARLEAEIASSALRVPDTLHGVIAARIDSLPAPAKTLLQTASVLGAPFDAALLREIAAEGGERSQGALERLVDAGLLEPLGDGRLEFRHVLMREVAYGQLLLARLRVLHERCAHAFVKRGLGATADGAARIGRHFERAGLPRDAATHLTQAGRAYLRVHAGAEAALHLGRAWQLLQAEGVEATARVSTGLALAAALNGLDRAREAGEVLDALAHAALGLTENRRVARACIEGGWVRFSERGDVDGGRQLLERGLELARSSADPRLELGAHAYLVRLRDLDGALVQAITSADRVFELGTELGDDFYRMLGLGSKASALCHGGQVELGLHAALEAARLADASESDIAIGLAQSFVAEALVYRGDPEGALLAAGRAREAGGRSRQTGALYHAEVWAAEALLLDGRPERAAEHLERMSAINASWPSTLRRRAVGLLALGRHHEAADIAVDCLARRPPRLIRARTQIVLGVALGRERCEGAQRALRTPEDARELCERLGAWPHVAEAEAAVAEVLAATGDPAGARRHADRAAHLYARSGMPLHAERARSSVTN